MLMYNISTLFIITKLFNSELLYLGASDDGVNCVVMLEILRGLAMSEILLQKCVIFLFNGAEEDGLLVH